MNSFLKGLNGVTTPASQNVGSDYCCSGADSENDSRMYVERLGDMIAQGLFLAHRPAAIQWRGDYAATAGQECFAIHYS
ncbi:hypothetical protein ACTJK3_20060 [Pseudomonas sp. 22105]|uniref:hypothetical protein n=1 Tax=Pseudomonas TaxID=286 RepID=UPI00111BD497|nr:MULTISPECIES: hypothetical protein [Pseudomonas]NKF29352.1 hypothetical protein [Pseudomonas sp. BG5]